MTKKDDEIAGQMWEKGWEGHEKAQLLRTAALPFAEKIRWLEEAQELIQTMKKVKEPLAGGADVSIS